ncbi:MAG: type II toxin-antitoxin system MqsA family antitoxin [Nitrospinae bacterium]|nr:type II toxin-antitoxin system MqsA family antitoxin [Nitrospinota bacterium]
MKCLICRQGETEKGKTTVTLERGESAIIVRGVPADVCVNCGEYYLDDDVARKVMELAESAVQRGSELEILRYAA